FPWGPGGEMKSYGQFCPVAKAAELFCERWTPLIVRDLSAGPCRFSQLQRGVPLMSATLLSRRLKQLEDHEVSVTVLAWTLERMTKPDAFGPDRCVLRLKFRDQPEHKSKWWFINEDGDCQICLKDPGHDVDLYLTTTVKDMIYIVRGDLSVTRAV